MSFLDLVLLPISLPLWVIARVVLLKQVCLLIKPPVVEDGAEVWRIQWVGASRIDEVRVPVSDASDGLSAPVFVRHWWRLWRYDAAGRLHDHIYTTGRYSRRTADMILYEACISVGIPRPRAALVWLCVRWFAKSHYKTP